MRLSDQVERWLDEGIKLAKSRKAPKIRTAWKDYKGLCAEQNPPVRAVSLTTFQRRYGETPKAERERSRHGRKAAHKAETRRPRASHAVPKDGLYGGHRAHMDHTLGDLEIKDSESNLTIGRAWITLVVDAFTDAILAIIVLFDSPSRGTVQCAIREIIRNYHWLPRCLVVDWGVEFTSSFMHIVNNSFRIAIEMRTKSGPKFGGSLERRNHLMHQEFIDALDGATKERKKVREMDPDWEPSKHAIWEYGELCDFAEEYRRAHKATRRQGKSAAPDDLLAKSRELLGDQPQRRWSATNPGVMALTAVPTARGGRSHVGPQGISNLGETYWCTELDAPLVQDMYVDTRMEMLEKSWIWAMVRNRWIKVPGEHAEELKGLTETERRRIAAVITQRNRRPAGTEEIIAFRRRMLKYEQDKITRRAEEQRKHLRAIVGGAAPAGVAREDDSDDQDVPVFAVHERDDE